MLKIMQGGNRTVRDLVKVARRAELSTRRADLATEKPMPKDAAWNSTDLKEWLQNNELEYALCLVGEVDFKLLAEMSENDVKFDGDIEEYISSRLKRRRLQLALSESVQAQRLKEFEAQFQAEEAAGDEEAGEEHEAGSGSQGISQSQAGGRRGPPESARATGSRAGGPSGSRDGSGAPTPIPFPHAA